MSSVQDQLAPGTVRRVSPTLVPTISCELSWNVTGNLSGDIDGQWIRLAPAEWSASVGFGIMPPQAVEEVRSATIRLALAVHALADRYPYLNITAVDRVTGLLNQME